MSIYADYSPDEQQLLGSSLEAAAIVVSAASPGRKEETISEGFAAATLVLESRAAYVGNTLVTSVIVEIERRVKAGEHFPDYLELATRAGAREEAIETLRRVVQLLETKAAPDEAAGYRKWLMDIAEAVAQAGKEDQGFLGMGGVAVNDAERSALAEIADILGVERSA